MSSEQTGLVALGVAAIAAVGSILDRVLARWRPRPRRDPARELARERAELSREWAEYRREIDQQLRRCRSENATLTQELTGMRMRVAILEAKVRSLGGAVE